MFSLKTTPEASQAMPLLRLAALDCDSVLCTTWRPKSTAAARSEIDAQEKFISFFKVGVLTRVMSGRDFASLETGQVRSAANTQVDDLGEVIRSLDKKAQGEFSLRFLVAARSVDELRGIAPAVHRVFVDARAQVMEETLGNLSAFYAMFPGNHNSTSSHVAGRRPSCALVLCLRAASWPSVFGRPRQRIPERLRDAHADTVLSGCICGRRAGHAPS